MADYVAILKKAIEGVDNPTPDMRQKVYDKARLTITRKIEAIDPPPPQAAVDRQMAILETAISDVEAEYVLSDATGVTPARTAPPPADKPAAPVPPPVMPKAGDDSFPDAPSVLTEPKADEKSGSAPAVPARADRLSGSAPRKKAGNGSDTRRMVTALAILIALGVAAFGAYTYRDQLSGMLGGSDSGSGEMAGQTPDNGGDDAVATGDQQAAADTDATPPADATDTQEETPPADTAQDDASTPPADPAEPKFTQRLLSDGSEVDEGPAGEEPGVGEGTSVAAVTQQPETPGADTATGEEPATDAGAAPADDASALPVGQKAIFYEERTASEDGSAIPGAVVWSVAQESPGNDQPLEPAIQAEIDVPDTGLKLRMTIRRNADTTLPASHIIELVFTTPEDFAGGAIDQVQRVTFKSTEQAPGNPLVALPAKIADGYFLVALNDAPSALQTNMTLLRREPWIDIPVTYKTGRRALITMEKGIPGDKVFDEVLKAWEAKTAASDG